MCGIQNGVHFSNVKESRKYPLRDIEIYPEDRFNFI